MITHLHPTTGSDLELPLPRHHLGVDACNLHAGVQASGVVRVGDITPDRHVRARARVVRALRRRLGPVSVEAQGFLGTQAHLGRLHQRVPTRSITDSA